MVRLAPLPLGGLCSANCTIGKLPEQAFLVPPAGIEPAIPSTHPELSGGVGGCRLFAGKMPRRSREWSARFGAVGANWEYKPSTRWSAGNLAPHPRGTASSGRWRPVGHGAPGGQVARAPLQLSRIAWVAPQTNLPPPASGQTSRPWWTLVNNSRTYRLRFVGGSSAARVRKFGPNQSAFELAMRGAASVRCLVQCAPPLALCLAPTHRSNARAVCSVSLSLCVAGSLGGSGRARLSRSLWTWFFASTVAVTGRLPGPTSLALARMRFRTVRRSLQPVVSTRTPRSPQTNHGRLRPRITT